MCVIVSAVQYIIRTEVRRGLEGDLDLPSTNDPP